MIPDFLSKTTSDYLCLKGLFYAKCFDNDWQKGGSVRKTGLALVVSLFMFL